jgi:hypothetical protein
MNTHMLNMQHSETERSGKKYNKCSVIHEVCRNEFSRQKSVCASAKEPTVSRKPGILFCYLIRLSQI